MAAKFRRQKSIKTNGVILKTLVEGKGPLVVLLHGFPSTGYMWKDVVEPLKAAGFRVAVPDQRGYGESSKPERIDAYSFLELTADVVGIADALGEEKFHLVGHDFGCMVSWYTALQFPHRLHSVTGLSIPFFPLGPDTVDPPGLDEVFWYIRYFQAPGIAEAELEADFARSFGFFKGDRTKIPARTGGRDSTLWPAIGTAPPPMGVNFTQEDFDYYVAAFKESGFRGPLNWYRNMGNVPAQMPWLKGAKILPPAYFIAGKDDPALKFFGAALKNQSYHFADFRGQTLIDGADHWVVAADAKAVSETIIKFIKEL